MKGTVLSMVAGAVALVSLTGTGMAQDATAPTASEQAKMKVAIGLVALGRMEQDPMMLIVGAKLLSGLEASGEGKEPDNASKAFDVSQILDEAKALSADDSYLLEQISDLAGRPERGNRYCNWYENCGYSIVDPFACEEVLVCN